MPISGTDPGQRVCDSVPDHSPFFIRNQVRSETSPSSAQTSGPVRRQISASRTIPPTADGVIRSRVEASERFGANCTIPGSIAEYRHRLIYQSGPPPFGIQYTAIWQNIKLFGMRSISYFK